MKYVPRGLIRRVRTIQSAIERISLPLYYGNTFYCPICGGHFRKLKPFKGKFYIKGELVDHFTPNSICPRCNSRMRHRFLKLVMEKNLDLQNGRKRILHFAPESYLAAYLKSLPSIDYISADIEPDRYPGSIKIDITNIDFPDNTFDVIINVHVLECIENDLSAMKEMFRVLKRGGKAIILIPIYGETTFEKQTNSYEERIKLFGLKDQYRLYGTDVTNRLKNAGFSVDVLTADKYTGNWVDIKTGFPHFETDKYLFICTKE